MPTGIPSIIQCKHVTHTHTHTYTPSCLDIAELEDGESKVNDDITTSVYRAYINVHEVGPRPVSYFQGTKFRRLHKLNINFYGFYFQDRGSNNHIQKVLSTTIQHQIFKVQSQSAKI